MSGRLVIDARYIRERPSGIGSYVEQLVQRLPALAPQAAVELWVDPRAPRPLTAFARVREHVVKAPANGLRTVLAPSALGRLREDDLFHAPFNLLGFGHSCATVVTVHDIMWLTCPELAEGNSWLSPFKQRFYRAGILQALHHASQLIAISQATADDILGLVPEAKSRLTVIHHGVHERFSPPSDRVQIERRLAADFQISGNYLLVLGQNSPSKHHQAVLEAFAHANLPTDLKLVFVQRLYRQDTFLKRAEQLGISDRTLCLPSVSSDQVLTLLRGALALIQFSRFEGFGMPALEAAACGTPVIASEIPALKEVLGPAAKLVPLHGHGLSRALEQVVRQPALRRELSQRGLERARAFSWARSAEQHLEVYAQAVRSAVRPTPFWLRHSPKGTIACA